MPGVVMTVYGLVSWKTWSGVGTSRLRGNVDFLLGVLPPFLEVLFCGADLFVLLSWFSASVGNWGVVSLELPS